MSSDAAADAVVAALVRSLSTPAPVLGPDDRPADNLHQVRQRQRQVDKDLFSIKQDRYDFAVPRKRRRHGDPEPPDPSRLLSKKRWDGRAQEWKIAMHAFDLDEDLDRRGRAPAPRAAPVAAAAESHTQQHCPGHALDLLGWLYRDALPPAQRAALPFPSVIFAPAAPPDPPTPASLASLMLKEAGALAAPARFDTLHDRLLRAGGADALALLRGALRRGMEGAVAQQAAAAAGRRARLAAFVQDSLSGVPPTEEAPPSWGEGPLGP